MANTKSKSAVKKAKPALKKASAVKKSAPKPARRKTKAPTPSLDANERRKLLKMRDDSDDVAERAAAQWGAHKDVRVKDLSPSKLLSLVAKAKKALQREQRLRAQLEAKIRPLQDARLIAEDAAYRALLDLHAQVKVLGRKDPGITEASAFLADHVAGTRDAAPAPADDEKP